MSEPPSRAALRRAHRVCIKAGTSVVANSDGRPSLTRLGSLTEQIAGLHKAGVQVMLVSSGAVGMGKQLLRKQQNLQRTFKEVHHGESMDVSVGKSSVYPRNSSFMSLLDSQETPQTMAEKKRFYDSACAAAGQFEMMNLYNGLFASYDMAASQILVTQADFADEHRLKNLTYSLERLLNLGIVPIINENDAVSANTGYTPDDVFSDNDSLAALCARHLGAEVLLLLTDVAGVYDLPPSDPKAKLMGFYHNESKVSIGSKSSQGRGGMQSKIDAACRAVSPGSTVRACVVAAGGDLTAVTDILGPATPGASPKGTLFCTPGSDLEKLALEDYTADEDTAMDTQAEHMAVTARNEARKLQALSYTQRQAILNAVADALISKMDIILEANALDLQAASDNNLGQVLLKRLGLTKAKLETLASGLRQIADSPNPLGQVQCKRELSEGLVLQQVTVPIGVLLIIFESRPDSMPQISALALASGNGLLLKGGKEAKHSNQVIHQVIGQAIEEASDGAVSSGIIGLVQGRDQIADLLKLDDVIDLVIPRGSNSLVQYIQKNTQIPVLGHADGICHVFVDAQADPNKASRIVVDSKVDYPSACNAMETLLLHETAVENGTAGKVLMALRAAGVQCRGAPRAMELGLCDTPVTEFHYEYGDLICAVQVVKTVEEAADWIHKYGSGHTESIVTEDEATARKFLDSVDAACVFWNSSTRFADGYRFGLGAEVGISTGRIHARGPVGVQGLLTTKWQLTSDSSHTVGDFVGENAKVYTHKDL